MVRNQPFITFKENDKFYIAQKVFPNYVGKITTDYPHLENIHFCNIHGYNMWVEFDGALTGNSVLMEPGWKQRIEETINHMATWYLENRINTNQKQYKKWLR